MSRGGGGGGVDGCFESPDNQQVWFHKRSEWSWLTAQLSPPTTTTHHPPPTIHPPPHPSARRTPPHAASHGSTCGRELLFASVSGQFAERGAAPSSTICWRDTGVIKLGGVKWLLWVWKLASFLQNKVKMGWQRCFIFSQTVQAHATGLGMIPDRLHSSLQSIDNTPGLSLHTLLTSPTPPDSAANNTQDTNSHSKTNRTGNTDLLWRHN